VIDDWERIASVEGLLTDVAAELNDLGARLLVCETNGCQLDEVAKHGEDMPGVDFVAACLWGRLFFHLGDLLVKRAVRIFSYQMA